MIDSNCKNCFYYNPHYAIDEYGQFYELNTGHCSRPKVQVMHFKRCLKTGTACIDWKQSEKPTLKENIIDTINTMAKSIEAMAVKLNATDEN